jgi:hypothetical protein
MIPVVRKYNLLTEKEAARFIGIRENRFNYYAGRGRGPEPALVAPDGRRYYESETIKAWSKPKLKAKDQEQGQPAPKAGKYLDMLKGELKRKAEAGELQPKKRTLGLRPRLEKL